MLRLVHERFTPNKILLLADGGARQRQLSEWLPFVETVSRKDGRATAYICEDYVCQLPTPDPDVVARMLDGTWKPARAPGRPASVVSTLARLAEKLTVARATPATRPIASRTVTAQ